jgi:hypothetical protein
VRSAGLRNLAIVLGLAAALAFLPGGGTTASVILQLISVIFLAGLAFLAYRLYREHRVALFSLGDGVRGTLYGSAALTTLAIVGAHKLWETSAGVLAWFALIAAAVFGLVTVVRAVREY